MGARAAGRIGLIMPPATQAIIGANVVVFVLQLTMGYALTDMFALWPLNGGFAPWQLVTYGFLHDPNGFAHIFFNMFAVYTFGSTLEQFFGTRWYVLLYFVSVVTAAVAQLAVNAVLGSPYPTLGASGGVYGLLLAFGMTFPRQRIMLLIPPIPMPAWVAVTLFGALELFLGVTGSAAGVAHFAHLGGMLGSFVMLQLRRGKPPFGRRRR
jgi:membrane associated rhomboid family serine protease